MSQTRYQWAASGDINAFFGLMLDNIAGLILALTILQFEFQFPVDFAIRYMVPGTAIGVLVGDLMYFVLAFQLARKTQRSDVTAMPLGLDTPSTIGMVYFVIGPAYQAAFTRSQDANLAATEAWHIGICAIIMTGLIKLLLAFGSNWAQRYFPRAGLLGSLAAIALGLIAFSQLPKLLANPLVGFSSLLIVLVALIARFRIFKRLPGALLAVGLGCLIWHLMRGIDAVAATQLVANPVETQAAVWFPREWLTVFSFQWVAAFDETLIYLPYIIPFAITTVIGGIDCTESAASVGDHYSTSSIISVEALATILAGICGGVIQTTPYIGHPAYKAMGGRAAYTLATALFVGGAGVIGYFGLMFAWIPEAAVLPILIFIGIEITSQSFHATPRRHYAALAFACLPAFAKLVMIYLGQFLGAFGAISPDFQLPPHLQSTLLYLSVLAGGFIITSLLWSSLLAEIIDRKFSRAAIYLLIAAGLTLFGVIHSPLAGDKMFLPWSLDWGSAEWRVVMELAGSYVLMAVLVLAIQAISREPIKTIETDEEFEKIA
jgi:AGZA family xanthine/uracil permease-like MFS transporter